MTGELASLARWFAYAAWVTLRDTFNDLPGPVPVKIALVVICLAIPGPQDEIALIAIARICRAWRKRQEARAHA